MYTDIISGTSVGAANTSSSTIVINEDTQLNWPSDSNNTTNAMTQTLYLSVTEADLTLYLPNATLASPGSGSLIVNEGPNAINIHYFSGDLLVALPSSETIKIELKTNSDSQGIWGTFSNPEGGAVVTSVSATPPARGIAIAGSPIAGGSGTFVFSLTNTLGSLETIGTGGATGYISKTADGTLALRSITPSNTNIVITNQAGVAGNTVIGLNADLTGLTSAHIGNMLLSGNGIEISNILNFQTDLNGVQNDYGYLIKDPTTNFTFKLYNPDNSLSSDVNYQVPTSIPSRSGSILSATIINGTTASIFPSKYNQLGVAGAWVQFNGSSFSFFGNNISTFTQTATGAYTVVFSNAFINTAIGSVGQCNTTDGSTCGFMTFVVVNASTINIRTQGNSIGSPVNYVYNSAVFYGILA